MCMGNAELYLREFSGLGGGLSRFCRVHFNSNYLYTFKGSVTYTLSAVKIFADKSINIS